MQENNKIKKAEDLNRMDEEFEDFLDIISNSKPYVFKRDWITEWEVNSDKLEDEDD